MQTTERKMQLRPGKIEYKEICERLNCTFEQLAFCRMKVGSSIKSIEAFWHMNKDCIRHMFPDRNLTTQHK